MTRNYQHGTQKPSARYSLGLIKMAGNAVLCVRNFDRGNKCPIYKQPEDLAFLASKIMIVSAGPLTPV